MSSCRTNLNSLNAETVNRFAPSAGERLVALANFWRCPPILITLRVGAIEVGWLPVRVVGLAVGLAGAVLLTWSAVLLGRFMMHEAAVREDYALSQERRQALSLLRLHGSSEAGLAHLSLQRAARSHRRSLRGDRVVGRLNASGRG
jgi:hypothetical protein